MDVNRVIITVISGADDGKVFKLDKTPITLGRNPDDDVYLPYDTRISRHHARITKKGGSYYIEDVGPEGNGSTNGTYVQSDAEKISGKTLLSSYDRILLGNVWLKFQEK